MSSPQLKALVSFSDQNFMLSLVVVVVIVFVIVKCFHLLLHNHVSNLIVNEGYASFLNEAPPLVFRR